jgi:hypothetical protein
MMAESVPEGSCDVHSYTPLRDINHLREATRCGKAPAQSLGYASKARHGTADARAVKTWKLPTRFGKFWHAVCSPNG